MRGLLNAARDQLQYRRQQRHTEMHCRPLAPDACEQSRPNNEQLSDIQHALTLETVNLSSNGIFTAKSDVPLATKAWQPSLKNGAEVSAILFPWTEPGDVIFPRFVGTLTSCESSAEASAMLLSLRLSFNLVFLADGSIFTFFGYHTKRAMCVLEVPCIIGTTVGGKRLAASEAV